MIHQAIAGAEFWESFVDVPSDISPDGEIKVSCPFHSWNVGHPDENPSFQINITTGLWHCWSCPDDGVLPNGGDPVEFVKAYFDVPFPVAKLYVESGERFIPISDDLVMAWQEQLQDRRDIIRRLSERAISEQGIRMFQLGWEAERLTIPIRNYRGEVVNVRRYSFVKKKNKLVSYTPPAIGTDIGIGLGSARLFPIDNALNGAPVFIMAGEMDTILACSLGFNAVCTTGGEAHWNPAWNRHFENREVYICYDIDKIGQSSAHKLALRLSEVAKHVSVITLPIQEPANGDFTDYVIQGFSTDYKSFVALAKPYSAPTLLTDHPLTSKSATAVSATLVETAFDPTWNGKRVDLEVFVPGKDLTPYTIAKKAEIRCERGRDDSKLCQGCALFHAGGKAKLELDPSNDMLHLIRTTDDKVQGELRRMLGIPGKCALWEMAVTEYQNVEELILSPRVETGVVTDLESRDTVQHGFYFYPPETPRIDVNQAYRMSAVRTTDPWKQRVTYIVDHVEHVSDTLALFQVTREMYESLSHAFQVKEGESVATHLGEVAREIVYHRTHIFGRDDLVIALLLMLGAVQQFEFQSQIVDNGLIELLVIGDTRTGKSESAASLLRWIGLGEVVTGEAVTFAGLVGGLQQGVDNHWLVTWGKIPQNHMKALVIDEVSGISVDDIAAMSGIRSARVAELVKIRQARTFARTRLGWMSNPRANRPLRAYSHGVEAVAELIGKPEDVARFDLVLACASGEVSDEIINQIRADTSDPPPVTIEAETLRNLILWAWTRKREHVVYTHEATLATLQAALEMGRTYSSRIPIVESANQRIKIARLAVSTAALVFSTDDTGEQVIVRPEHVEFARTFMDEAYSKPSLDYYGFSRREKEDEEIANKARPSIERWIRGNPALAKMIARSDTFSGMDLMEQLNLDKSESTDHLHVLSEARMIAKQRHGYAKTAAMIQLLKEANLG